MTPTIIFLSLLAGSLVQSVAAQTSLYIPGFDPQPISANIIGVGSDGRTTWQLAPGVTSGSFDDIGLIGTATLVAGPNDAQVTLSAAGLVLDQKCSINDGLSDCTVVAAADGTTSTFGIQETASPFEIQGGPALTSGDTSPTSGIPASSSSSHAPESPQTGSTSVGSPSQTDSAPLASDTTADNNSAGAKLGLSNLVWVVVVFIFILLN